MTGPDPMPSHRPQAERETGLAGIAALRATLAAAATSTPAPPEPDREPNADRLAQLGHLAVLRAQMRKERGPNPATAVAVRTDDALT